MGECFKLKLTRNRLFEFDNCVSFCASVKTPFDFFELQKALKMLYLKEPILSGKIELCDDSEAVLETEFFEPLLENSDCDAEALCNKIRENGIDFWDRLFRFFVSSDGGLCIFAHTIVADARSLAFLASELIGFYNKKYVSGEPSKVKLFSNVTDLPSNVFSPVIDRIASDLEVGWQKKIAEFTKADFIKARENYKKQKNGTSFCKFEISKDEFCELKKIAVDMKADISSLVAFAFHSALTEYLGGKRKYRKLNVQANERIFFDDYCDMNVGAYNGIVTVFQKNKKNAQESVRTSALDFHKEIYKRLTSSFTVFYNEVLFMKLPPAFCDSAYMYKAGLFSHKYSRRLADTYGCANEVAGEFCSYNFDQRYWSGISDFEKVTLSESLKMRSSCLITFIERNEKAYVRFDYKSDKISDDTAEKICNRAKKIVFSLAL